MDFKYGNRTFWFDKEIKLEEGALNVIKIKQVVGRGGGTAEREDAQLDFATETGDTKLSCPVGQNSQLCTHPLLLSTNPRSEALSSVFFKIITYRLMKKLITLYNSHLGRGIINQNNQEV